MNVKHKYFTQFMLKNGYVTLEEGLSFYKTITRDNSLTETQLKMLILELNREISKQYFRIIVTTCEVTSEAVIIWLNTKNDNISKFQNSFTSLELEYFNTIMKDIVKSEERKITFSYCLNITSTLTGKLTRDNGQKVLNRWIKGGYFIKIGGDIHLGMRTILEFTTHLLSLAPTSVCGLCSELVFTGKICAYCDKIFHSLCLDKYFQNQQSCPNCKTQWQGTETFKHPSQDNMNNTSCD